MLVLSNINWNTHICVNEECWSSLWYYDNDVARSDLEQPKYLALIDHSNRSIFREFRTDRFDLTFPRKIQYSRCVRKMKLRKTSEKSVAIFIHLSCRKDRSIKTLVVYIPEKMSSHQFWYLSNCSNFSPREP